LATYADRLLKSIKLPTPVLILLDIRPPILLKADAEAWLSAERLMITLESWTPAEFRQAKAKMNRPMAFGDYSQTWLKDRELKPRTRSHYRSLLEKQLNPWNLVAVKDIRPEMVREWHTSLDSTRPTLRAHSYGLLRAILATAVDDGLLPVNPCHIRGAGNSKKVHLTKPATLKELDLLIESLPNQYRSMILLAAWCALRFGELVELRRKDLDLIEGVIHVRRGVVRAGGEIIIGTPKSEAGIRDVTIPPHLYPELESHLKNHVGASKDSLLFPASDGKSNLAPSTLYTHFYKARESAGRPDLRFHDLRHTGAVLAAGTGATLADLRTRLGHSTVAAALRYQHAVEGKDRFIANELSKLVLENPTRRIETQE
jgi:integrase